MKTIRLALLGMTVASACTPSAGRVVNVPYAPRSGPAPEAVRACLDHEETQHYLAALHEKVITAWAIEYGTRRHEVVARVSIDREGALRDAHVLRAPDDELAGLALTAIVSSQPFGPLPDAASCLHEEPLILRFRTKQY